MQHNTLSHFKSGVHNRDDAESIPADAAQDSLNFITKDGRLVLTYGRLLVGDDGGPNKVRANHYGYKIDGTKIHYKKTGTTIKYLKDGVWTDIITDLTESAEYTFANHSSLAGAFTYVCGVDGLWKIVNANPENPIGLYTRNTNFLGKIIIDRGRMLLWDRQEAESSDKTGLYGSHIDLQDYLTISDEVVGAFGSTDYTHTMVTIGGGRTAFGLEITGTTIDGEETFTDDYLGNLTSDKGGTGTVNYSTGEISVSFNSAVISGNVLVTYQYDDPLNDGIVDFNKSATRIAAEGFVFPQDEGGDAILNVVVGQDGAYYSFKENSVYRLILSDDDLSAENIVYRKDVGIPNFRAVVSTSIGIVFMNTGNPIKPELTVLRRGTDGDNIEPSALFEHFDFAQFNYEDCAMETTDRFVVVACRSTNSKNNDIILLCNVSDNTVDIIQYPARVFSKKNGYLYAGSPFSGNIHELFSGFDDDGYAIVNHWTSKDEMYGADTLLKKYRRRWIKGKIARDQVVEVYEDYDGAGFELIGTIRGDASYVDSFNSQAVGSTIVGDTPVGGDITAEAAPYFLQLKPKPPKFRKRTVKIVAKGIGYFDIELIKDYDLLTFEERIPKRFRQKQNVSLDGATVDQ